MTTIAFLGLGQMGGPMAHNLVKAGHTVRAFDVVPAAVQKAKEGGCMGCTTVSEAVQGAQLVITMLPTTQSMEDLYLGSGNLLALVAPTALLIDSSTVAPQAPRKAAAAAQAQGLAFIDAPVSGGVAGALAGTLTFICGGDDDAVERARPFLLHMGKNVFHAGGHGAGQVAKICNNMLLAIHMIGTAEALQLGVDNGLDPKTLSEIMMKSSGRNWSLELYNPYPGVMDNVPASRHYDGGFKTRLMNKDLSLAMEAAQASGSTTPLGALARNLYAMHGRAGADDLDFSSIQKLFATLSVTKPSAK
ncbi:MAG: 3-hydroxyisobutyrate dehydrogenase [Pseudomonadota bacterium]